MRVGLVQLTSSDSVENNLVATEAAIRQVALDGADVVVLPENFAAFGAKDYRAIADREGEKGGGPILNLLCRLAADLGIWICAGTIPFHGGDDSRPFAATFLIDSRGKVVARYHKIHLFDAQVPDRQGQYCESDSYAPGRGLSVIDTPFGRLGLAVCYDLRFPEMFLAYRKLGVSVILIPSAFTDATGSAHWETLIRCRAIEQGCFIVAANQGGVHWNQRQTWGHSMVVDPWGTVIGMLDKKPATSVVDVSLSQSQQVRQSLPTQWHREQRWARKIQW